MANMLIQTQVVTEFSYYTHVGLALKRLRR